MSPINRTDRFARDVTILSTADWDYPFWTNKQHVAVSLTRQGCRVLYVDSLGLRPPRLETSDVRRILGRCIKFLTSPRLVQPNLWVLSPFLFPAAQNRWLIKANSALLRLQLLICRQRIGLRSDILWTYNPALTDYIPTPKLSFRQVVYHCVDNISAQPSMDSEGIQEKERQLCSLADVTFVTSQVLYNKIRLQNQNTFLYPNVADIAHFAHARSPALQRPSDLKGLAGPIIGFIGAISAYKLNFALIERLAKHRPDCQLVFIGRIGEGDSSTDPTPLYKLPNIHLLGPKAYLELPVYLHFFDIALLPCLINDYTSSMFPMKFFEYVAAGVPVVSTKLPSLNGFERYASICLDDDMFISAIDRILTFSKGVGLRAPVPLEDLPSWCGYDERSKLMLSDLQRLSGGQFY